MKETDFFRNMAICRLFHCFFGILFCTLFLYVPDTYTQTVQSDPNGHFNVRLLGAKGDGQTNDTRVFQDAIDAAAKVRGTVFVPAGTYRVGQLTMHDHTSLVGEPGWSYYIPGGSVLELNDSTASTLIDFTWCKGSRLNGLSLVGRRLGKNIHGVQVRTHDKNENSSSNHKVEDFPAIERCMVYNFTGNGLDADVWCMSLRGCAIGRNQGDGFNYRGADAMIIDNWFSGNGGAGIRAEVGTGNSTVTANRIEWNQGGNIVLSRAWSWNITGNAFDRATGPNLYAKGSCYQLCITGNTFLRSGNRNSQKKIDLYNDPLNNSNVRLESSFDVVFTSNIMAVGGNDPNNRIISSTPDYGLVIADLTDAVIANNVLAGVKEPLIDLGEHGGNVIVRDNAGRTVFDADKRTPPATVHLRLFETTPDISKLAQVLAKEKAYIIQRWHTDGHVRSGDTVMQDSPIGSVIGEVRLGASPNTLLLDAIVKDGLCNKDSAVWHDAAIEVYVWTPEMPRATQLKFIVTGPSGAVKMEKFSWEAVPQDTSASTRQNPWRVPAPPKLLHDSMVTATVLAKPLTTSGYAISAAIPFKQLGLSEGCTRFWADIYVVAAERRIRHHVAIFHSQGALFSDIPGKILAPIIVDNK